jgi:glycosyltransferase involved in cell wall biosynthesis
MLNLALFSHTRHLCGAERMLLNLAVLLQRSGTVHPVLLVPGEGDLIAAARRHGLDYDIVPAAPWYVAPPRRMSDYRRGVEECFQALRTTLVDLNCDAVLVNTLTSVPAMLAAVELDLPSLVWVHGVLDSLLLPAKSSEFAAAHDELLLHGATRVIALPHFTSEFCARVMTRTDIDVIPNWTPVDPDFTAPPQKYGSRRLVCLNSFDVHKGHGTLLKAAALLKARNVSFELDLYGDGPLLGEVKRQAAALGLQDCVRFPGRTADVQAVYDCASCVVNSADVEPFPMTLIEPMARKTPVVATRSGGASEIVVDGQCGYLVDRGDASTLADRTQAILDSPELARRLGDAGFQRAGTHFSEASARAAFLPVIESGIRNFRGYEPAVKTMAKIYRLGLVGTGSREKAEKLKAEKLKDFRFSDFQFSAFSLLRAFRLAKGGLRRTRALGRRMLTLFGLQ